MFFTSVFINLGFNIILALTIKYGTWNDLEDVIFGDLYLLFGLVIGVIIVILLIWCTIGRLYSKAKYYFNNKWK
jgi:hypothetical protein